jgi:hypothetical protein
MYVDSIYQKELEIKYTAESSTSASYLDVLLKLDTNGKITTHFFFINRMISISLSSTSLTYLVIFQLTNFTCIWFIYIAAYSIN